MKIIDYFKNYVVLFYYLALFLYLETINILFSGYKLFEVGVTSRFVYLLFMSTFCFIFTLFFNKKISTVITYCITVAHCIYYAVQFGSYKILNVYFTLSVSDSAGEILQFKNELVGIIKNYFFLFLLFFIPIIVLYFINKYLNYPRFTKIHNKVLLVFLLTLINVYLMTLNTSDTYSAKELTYSYNDMALSVPKLGLSNSGHLDFLKYIFDFQETITYTTNTIVEEVEEVIVEEVEIVYGLNVLDIDFESNSNSISDYLMNEPGTYKNKYTGMFKDKNVILIMAESFTDIAVIPELTPTLYQLIHEGFDFTNFYSPTIFSTLGGEFQMLTGLYPTSDSIKEYKTGSLSHPYSIAQTFIDNGYTTNAYHNNEYTFQSRDKYIPALGFETFMACGNGLEEYIDSKWLQSDTDMINSTVDFYCDEDKFFTFYATVSGHGSYDRSNKYAVANMDIVEEYLASNNLDYSSEIKYYIGAQMELDNALSALLMNLENKGLLADTVIVLAGDHYPYLIPNEIIAEAAPYNKDDAVDINKSNLIIWNSEMESEVIDKIGSQMDIVPTIFNLVGFDYDSRIIVGKDILSNSEGLAIFTDRSWISDKGRYYIKDKQFIANDDIEVDDDYVQSMNSQVSTRISISSQIVLQGYYSDLKLNTSNINSSVTTATTDNTDNDTTPLDDNLDETTDESLDVDFSNTLSED